MGGRGDKLHIFDSSHQADDYGWHIVDGRGDPYAHVFAGVSISHGSTWVRGEDAISVTASHEVLEMLVDPAANEYTFNGLRTLWSREVCDPVQSDAYRIVANGMRVAVSNFVYPRSSTRGRRAVRPPRCAHGAVFDRARRLRDCRTRDTDSRTQRAHDRCALRPRRSEVATHPEARGLGSNLLAPRTQRVNPSMVDLGVTTPWRSTAVLPEYRDRSLLEVFRELAVACSDRTAVRDGERSLSYRELQESIEAIAGAVCDGRATGPAVSGEQPWTVSAVLGHGIDALLTVYGVMAAGAVLVPIDAAEPVERMVQIHRAGGADLVIGTAEHADRTRAMAGCRICSSTT